MGEHIISGLQQYVQWVESLRALPEKDASMPYADGKWSPKEILMHMAEWDRFTLEERLPYMKDSSKVGEVLTDIPFNAFNAEAARKAKELTFDEIRIYAVDMRSRLLSDLAQLEEEQWDAPIRIGEFTITTRQYFADFIEHDKHHKMQIDSLQVI
ncbi:DinB family protein [Sporosarcina sp. Te-1]|uniref:DinB family protein n=1 Tax=Sporosarcina sp. Te-1 TaxID=2818390 RepID=UPI001A9DFAC8|nr:DinB family protein [Sporosarcina sp. Te-1]QTD40262.1 DinB family protein [Sporosarcina sp. Te-1]